ncbi:hypothetical protein PQ455_16515 [Sphingomonas naphthae]|uniref:DUF2927 domain-containing protein n=1 Tax=Sphingomonas naphthae TaxID=1813468 RepID=A0ABY7TJ01_9SPHN|nr:hypothetical protein [Sphingomonas naphthae]WCT73203.1 hypothetical protein PQ455_16515 [Sphingomonas naphthae]
MRLLMTAALMALAAPALAQTPPPGDDIVVKGRKAVESKEARQFITKAMPPIEGQYARFRNPICPQVIGMPQDYADRMTARMRAIATDARIPVDKAKCRANVVVFLVENSKTFVNTLHNTTPDLFTTLDADNLRHLLNDEAPVRTWSTTHIANEDGMGVQGGTLFVQSASIILLPTTQLIDGAIVVIDQAAAVGKTLTQLSDYAAMRAFARTRPMNAAESDSILALFDPAATALPRRLTAMDASFLRGLYHGKANRKWSDQKRIIAKSMAKDGKGEGRP